MSKDVKKIVKNILKKKKSPLQEYLDKFCKDCENWMNPCELTKYGANFMFFCVACRISAKGIMVLDELGTLIVKAGEEILESQKPSMVV